MTDTKKREQWEIACGLAWFTLDGCWLMQWEYLCFAGCACALISAAMIVHYRERTKVAFWVCMADTSWIVFNVFWAIGDLTSVAWETFASKILFLAGGLLYGQAFDVAGGTTKLKEFVLRPLRFMSALTRWNGHD